MASRPFASVMLPVGMITDNSEPDHAYYNTKVQATRQSQSAVDSISPFQRTSSKRNKSKAMQLRSVCVLSVNSLHRIVELVFFVCATSIIIEYSPLTS